MGGWVVEGEAETLDLDFERSGWVGGWVGRERKVEALSCCLMEKVGR